MRSSRSSMLVRSWCASRPMGRMDRCGRNRAWPGHAFSGLTYLAGEPGGVPVVPGSTSLADYMSGMYGAIGALVALRAREASGEGQCTDLALYEAVFGVLAGVAPAAQRIG